MKASTLLRIMAMDDFDERPRKSSNEIDSALKLVRFLKAADKKPDAGKKPKVTATQLTLCILAFSPLLVALYGIILAVSGRFIVYQLQQIPHP